MRKKLWTASLACSGNVDLAVLEPLEEFVRGKVYQLDLVRLLEDGVGHRLAHLDAGDLGDHVVEALQVLDVHRGVDVDARVQQLEHVLPPLWVSRAGRVGMGEFVNQDEGGTAREHRIEIEFLEGRVSVRDLTSGKDGKALEQRLGLGAAVRIDPADQDVEPFGATLMGRLQHGVGLTDTGGGAEEDLESTPLLRGFPPP